MVLHRTRIHLEPFVRPIDVQEITAAELLWVPEDSVALVEDMTRELVPRLAALLHEARQLVAQVYLGQRPDLPEAALVPVVYVLVEQGRHREEIFDGIAAAGAVPIYPGAWEAEQEALKPLLLDPLPDEFEE